MITQNIKLNYRGHMGDPVFFADGNREEWGTITANSYITNVLTPGLWPFWYWESYWAGSLLTIIEDREAIHRTN